MKKFIISIILTILTLINFSLVSAQEIIIAGSGASYEDAERDALRNAVEKAVGLMVDSQTLVQNSQLVNDEIYTQSKGYITNYTVLERKNNGTSYKVTINADVDTKPDSKLMNELTRLGIINKQLRDPKIAVIIPEYHFSARIPDPAGETAVIKKLTEAGFSHVTDVSNIRYQLNKLSALTSNDFRSLADSLNVDILIIGEAFSQGVGDVGKFIGNGRKNVGILSCKARLEAKIFIVKSGQIIAANGTYGTAADLTEFIAAKKALNDAGEKMGDYIVEKLIDYGSGSKQNLEVTVIASDINKITKICNIIKNISGVNSANITNYSNGRANITVKYSGTPQNLYNQLNKTVDFNVVLKGISYNTLSIGAY